MDAASTVLILHAGIATVWDIAQRRIPNWLIVSGLLLGIAFQTQSGGLAGLGLALLGAVTALVALIAPFALRWMGGGDVKLAMVCGAFTGWDGALHIILVGTVVHGLLGIVVLTGRALRRSMGHTLPKPRQLPHAVGFGVAVVLYAAHVARFF